jgi:hypothetical protein
MSEQITYRKPSELSPVSAISDNDIIIVIQNDRFMRSTVGALRSGLAQSNLTINDIVGLSTALQEKSNIDHTHSLNIDSIDGLAQALQGKADSDHTHSFSVESIDGLAQALNDLTQALSGKSDSGHTHVFTIGSIEGLEQILEGKANSDHSHSLSINDIEGLVQALEGKASSNHTHEITISDVTGLDDALNSADARIQSVESRMDEIESPVELILSMTRPIGSVMPVEREPANFYDVSGNDASFEYRIEKTNGYYFNSAELLITTYKLPETITSGEDAVQWLYENSVDDATLIYQDTVDVIEISNRVINFHIDQETGYFNGPGYYLLNACIVEDFNTEEPEKMGSSTIVLEVTFE